MEQPSVGIKIVERIAEREGVDPVDLDSPLHDVVDADKLEALTSGTDDRQSRANLRVEFTYYGYVITVGGNGMVVIDKKPTEAERTSS